MGFTYGTPIDAEFRICKSCEKTFPNTHEYFNYASKKTGQLNAICKECQKAQNKDRYKDKIQSGLSLQYEDMIYDGTKKCKRCGRDLPNDYRHFIIDKSLESGLRNICRECYGGRFLADDYTPPKKWTQSELDLLKEVYSKYDNEEIQRRFFPDRTIRSIQTQADIHGYTGKDEDVYIATRKKQGQKISPIMRGRVVSEETRKKLSDNKKEYYKTHNSWAKGIKLSEERCKQISERQKGHWAGDKNPSHINPRVGELNGRWDGGAEEIKTEYRTRIPEWKNDSMAFCNYRCVITGQDFHDIHHTTPFNAIFNEMFELSCIDKRKKVGDYTKEELDCLDKTIKDLHLKYGLGVCLNKDVHKLFHDHYGYVDFSLNDFILFVNEISDGKYDDWFSKNNLQININQQVIDYLIRINNESSEVT